MITKITSVGIELTPENYQDGLALVEFYKNVCQNKIETNVLLDFNKKEAGGNCSWEDVEDYYWERLDREDGHRKNDRDYFPIGVEEITGLTIGKSAF